MVNSIAPTYYAPGDFRATFALEGINFSLIPQNAVGILSDDNNNPEVYRTTTAVWNIANVNVADDSHMDVTQDAGHSQVKKTYLGMIVSNDRSIVYWVNNTRPLP